VVTDHQPLGSPSMAKRRAEATGLKREVAGKILP